MTALTMATIAGRAAGIQGRPFTDCLHRDGKRRRDWVTGYVAALVSQKSQNGADGCPFNVKQPARDGRPDWAALEDVLVQAGLGAALTYDDLEAVMGRSAAAIRVRASRLGLTERRAA